MSETGTFTSRVAAVLRRRETLRIGAPAAAAVVIVGVLLGVFLTGGSDPDGSTGQSVDIEDRTAESTDATVSPADEAALLPLIEAQVLDELNVKELRVAGDDEIAEVRIRPNLPVLGPRLGAQIGAARAAIAAADPAGVAAALRAEGSVELGGIAFAADDLLVETEDRPGVASASEGGAAGLLVGIDTMLTPELEAEGLARELVHRVQTMRKAAGFDIEDRIRTYVSGADPRVLDVLRVHAAYYEQETLSEPVREEAPPSGAHAEQLDLDGAGATLAIARV